MATGLPGAGGQHPLEGGRGAVEVTALHGLLSLGKLRLPVTGGLATGQIPVRRLGGLAVTAGQADLLRDLENLAEPLAYLRLGQGAEESRHELAADHGEHHGDALHLQRGAQLRVGIHIHLGQHPGTGRLDGEFLQDRAELLARATPLGPQIQDHRDGAGAFQHIRLECRLCHVEHVLAVRSARAVGGCGLFALRGRLARAQIDRAVQREVPRLLHDSILPHRRRCFA